MTLIPAFTFFLCLSEGSQNYGYAVLCPGNVLTVNCPIPLKTVVIQLTIAFKDFSIFFLRYYSSNSELNSILTSSVLDSTLLY